ncbi:MAG TPA: sulfotransferase family 2 domain-containing protein [Rhodothermales bacterium]
MISHRHKCIFIHIPKCAGTTVETALEHFDDHTGRRGQDHRTIRMIEPLAPLRIATNPANCIELLRRARYRIPSKRNPRSNARVTAAQYREYFKFTIVRNPWSRAVSVYRNVMNDPIHIAEHGVTAATPFSDFLRRHIGRGMLRPQMDWIVDWSGNIPLDFIGRFENLADDFGRIAEVLGPVGLTFDPAPPLELGSWFDGELDALVRKTYAEEIEYFRFAAPTLERRAANHC